jgi:hypothetical protein
VIGSDLFLFETVDAKEAGRAEEDFFGGLARARACVSVARNSALLVPDATSCVDQNITIPDC